MKLSTLEELKKIASTPPVVKPIDELKVPQSVPDRSTKHKDVNTKNKLV